MGEKRMLEIKRLTLGPVQTNTYLVADNVTRQAAVIDPAWDGERIAAEALSLGWTIGAVWITHAHFDHFGGAAGLVSGMKPPLVVALHPQDLPLWKSGGGGGLFGLRIDEPPAPSAALSDRMVLPLGGEQFEVRHCPGHSPGHVIFVCETQKTAFVGDVIFKNGIGRSDLPGGNEARLLRSIRENILSLPDDVRLYPGHGAQTTVGAERRANPFLVNGSQP
jgi:glyoxylase-like metal-dependent hydrolase (beta-lactamase superfamily II)